MILIVPENLNISSIPRRTEAFGGFLINTITALMERKLDISYLDSVSRRAWADTVLLRKDIMILENLQPLSAMNTPPQLLIWVISIEM